MRRHANDSLLVRGAREKAVVRVLSPDSTQSYRATPRGARIAVLVALIDLVIRLVSAQCPVQYRAVLLSAPETVSL